MVENQNVEKNTDSVEKKGLLARLMERLADKHPERDESHAKTRYKQVKEARMTQYELNDYIEYQELWLKSNGEQGKEIHIEKKSLNNLDLSNKNLSNVYFYKCDMSYCNFKNTILKEAMFIECNLSVSDFSNADLSFAYIQNCNAKNARFVEANLDQANLRKSDFTGANFDFASLPLWCGFSHFKADDRFVAQILAHLCTLEVSSTARSELNKIIDFARTSHRAKDLKI
jgi:hypothetical protein